MGRQVIRQPDGLYAVFSSGTDQWVAWGLTREQYIERRADEAAREAQEDAARLLDEVGRRRRSPRSAGPSAELLTRSARTPAARFSPATLLTRNCWRSSRHSEATMQ